MIKSKKEPLSSSKPQIPTPKATAPKPTLATRPSVSATKPKVTPQKEVPKTKTVLNTPVRPKTADKTPKLSIKEVPKIVPGIIEVTKENKENNEMKIPVIIPESVEVIEEETEDNVEKKIPKAFYHKPSFSNIFARQIKKFYGKVQGKSTSTIAIKYKLNPWTHMRKRDIIEMWKMIEKPLRVHRWKSLRSIDFDWQPDLEHRGSPIDSEEVLREMFNHDSQDDFVSLTDLRINIESPAQLVVMKDPGLLPFSIDISRYLVNLRCLTINLRFSSNETEDESFGRFGYILSHRLAHLNYLDLLLNGEFMITDEGFGKFVTQIGFCTPKLNYLGLELSGFSEVTDIGFRMLKSLFSSTHNKLKTLKLIFSDCPNFSYDVLANILLDFHAPLPNLTSFLLCPDRLTDEGMAILGSTLANFYPNLEDLSLRLSRCYKVTQDGLSAFGSHITGRLNKLQSIKIHGIPFRSVDDHLITIGNQILLKFPDLKALSLTFMACNQLTNSGLQFLTSEVLPKLTNLRQLSLNFAQSHIFSDKTFQLLGHHISSDLINLRRLALNFSGWYKIKEKDLEDFVSNITTHLLNLRSLDLNFSLCDHIKEDAVDRAIIKIANISKRLKELSLNFTGFDKKKWANCELKAKQLLKRIPILSLEF